LAHGRLKGDRMRQRSESDKAQKDLEQHRIERGDG
jgi:hypothetical protein